MLTEEEKCDIKKAILKAVENGCNEPDLLVCKLIKAFDHIDKCNKKLSGLSL